MNNLSFPICAVLINILILSVFYSKKRYKSEETNAYSILVNIGFSESTLACILIILMNKYGIPNYIFNLHRIDYVLMLFWVWGLLNYVLIVSVKNKKTKKSFQKITFIFSIFISISFFFFDVNVINKDGIIDTNGPAMNVLFGSLVLYVILIIKFVLKSLIGNIKSSNNKKFIPLLFLAILGILALIIRSVAPEVIMVSLVAAYADLIMFFTIENPDVKVIHELNKNKKLIESMSEEKSNFLFSMSQETKKPIENIIEVNNILEKEENMENIKEGLKVIDNNARNLKNIINNVLDLSTIDSSKIIATNETYNFNSLITMCIKKVEEKIDNDVVLRTNISNNIPQELFGDSVKLKQVITSILYNSAKYTKKGFIEVNVTEIVKYDVCRLIISVEDTGCGMSAQKLNELLKKNSSLEDTDLLKMNELDVDLKVAFKIINKLGGFINIKSEEKKGSTFTIVIDQKIKESESLYKKYLFNEKKVIVISDKIQLLKEISALSNEFDFELLTSLYSNDLVQRIRNGEVFDLILLEDEMIPDSALTVLGKMQDSVKGFKIPTIVMLNKNKESIKEHYLEDGFDDYIRKEYLKEDFEKVIKKYM